MLGLIFDILHWIAGAVLALVGISYDRVDDCAPPVRQQTIEEASLITGDAMIHQASSTVELSYTLLPDGRVVVNVQPAAVTAVSDCVSASPRLPEAPALPVLRL